MDKIDIIYMTLVSINKLLDKMLKHTKRSNKKDLRLESTRILLSEVTGKFYDYKHKVESYGIEPPLDTIKDDPYDENYALVYQDTSRSGMFSTYDWVKVKKK